MAATDIARSASLLVFPNTWVWSQQQHKEGRPRQHWACQGRVRNLVLNFCAVSSEAERVPYKH